MYDITLYKIHFCSRLTFSQFQLVDVLYVSFMFHVHIFLTILKNARHCTKHPKTLKPLSHFLPVVLVDSS